MSASDVNKRKAIKLSKEYCQLIKDAESQVWIGVLEKCLNQGYEKPKRIRFRQTTLENGYALLQQETDYYYWVDLSYDIFEDNGEYYCDISRLQSKVRDHNLNFWITSFTNHYLHRMVRKAA